MEIKFTEEESENHFYNALCNGLSQVTNGYGLQIDYQSKEYKSAKKKLIKQGKETCYEDILMQVLRNGKKLTLVDVEGAGENTKSITLEDVHKKVELIPIRHLADMITDNDDADTADVVLQTVFFDKIIFG